MPRWCSPVNHFGFSWQSSFQLTAENIRRPEFKRFFTQLLFSYKINPRTVLFLGYTDNYFDGHEYGMTKKDYTFFAKIGYAWVM